MMSNSQFSPQASRETRPFILAVDTSSARASLAIAREDQIIGSLESDASTPHSKVFFSLLASLLQSAGLSLEEIEVFAAAIGPGSFTGLRVGISALKGISRARGKLAIGVNSLDALSLTTGARGKVLAVIDAGRAEVYAGLREIASDTRSQTLGTDMVGQMPSVIEAYEQQTRGERVSLTGNYVRQEQLFLPANWQHEAPIMTIAEAIGIHAAQLINKPNGSLDQDAGFNLQPCYIRRPDAELKKP